MYTPVILALSKVSIILLIVLGVLAVIAAVLYFLGRRLQKKQDAQQEQIEAAKQIVPMLILDKKRVKIKDAKLPAAVIEGTPKYLRWSKVPVITARVGGQVMTLICEEKIYDSVPVKREVKAAVSGIYVTSVKGMHGKPLPVETKQKSKFKLAIEKAQEKLGAKSVK